MYLAKFESITPEELYKNKESEVTIISRIQDTYLYTYPGSFSRLPG